jgi:hypothetical protein
MALAKKGVRASEIGLEMGFVGNAKLAADTFQKVKNKIYFELDKRNELVNEGYPGFTDKKVDAKLIADKMRKDKSTKGFADKVEKMGKVSQKDLDNILPDYVTGGTIEQLFKESVNEEHDCGCNENHDCGCGGLHEHHINEDINADANGIAGLTASRANAVKDFLEKNNINSNKLYLFLKKGNLKDRMDFVTALVGKPGNPIQKKVIAQFSN